MEKYGIASLEEAKNICMSKNIDVNQIIKAVQPIAFENASWAYILGSAIAIKKQVKTASEAAQYPLSGLLWRDISSLS
jgi:hypothetical protein